MSKDAGVSSWFNKQICKKKKKVRIIPFRLLKTFNSYTFRLYQKKKKNLELHLSMWSMDASCQACGGVPAQCTLTGGSFRKVDRWFGYFLAC